jgi:hypothetical protein
VGSIDDAQRANWKHFMDRGPGLSYGYQQYVIARRPASGEILLGGLGGMGIGEMWLAESADDEALPGYAEAEIL